MKSTISPEFTGYVHVCVSQLDIGHDLICTAWQALVDPSASLARTAFFLEHSRNLAQLLLLKG